MSTKRRQGQPFAGRATRGREPQSTASDPKSEVRACVLREAGEWLAVKRPGRRAVIRLRLANRLIRAAAEWEFPGVVRVVLQPSGELLCKSKPGHPEQVERLACVSGQWNPLDADESSSQARALADLERKAILRIARDALRAKARPTSYVAHIATGQAWRCVRVGYAWPGVVDVTDCETGELLARSEPGLPTVPGDSVPAVEQEGGR